MTKDMQELGPTDEQLAAKTVQMEALVNGESKLDGELKASIALVDKKQRSKPIKGKCVNCGRHYSRHFAENQAGGLVAYCSRAANSMIFDLERPAIAQQPRTAIAGLIARQKDLYSTLHSRMAELDMTKAQIEDLSDNEVRLQNIIDGLNEDIEAVYAEMLKGE